MLAFRNPETSRGELDVAFTGTGTGESARRLEGDVTQLPPTTVHATASPRVVPLMNFGEALMLRYPLFIVVEESDGAIVASSFDLELAEYGETEFEALDNIRAAVLELYGVLCEMEDPPPHLASKRRFLKALSI